MDHNAYLKTLRARISHLATALEQSIRDHQAHPIRDSMDALLQHAVKIESEGEPSEHHREAVENTLHEIQNQIESDESTLGQMAESVRDGALELFRSEPSELVRRTEAVMEKLRKA